MYVLAHSWSQVKIKSPRPNCHHAIHGTEVLSRSGISFAFTLTTGRYCTPPRCAVSNHQRPSFLLVPPNVIPIEQHFSSRPETVPTVFDVIWLSHGCLAPSTLLCSE